MAIVFVASCAITFASFSASSMVDGVDFSFAKLDVSIVYDSGTSSKNTATKSVGSVATGTPLFRDVKVRLDSSSVTGYVRVKLNYSGVDGDSQKTAVALNSILPLDSTYTGSSIYAWKESGGYLYLVNKNKTQLKSLPKGETYTIFSSLAMPDLTQFGGTLSTSGVKLEIRAEALESANLKTSSGTSVTTVPQLESVISEGNIFGVFTDAGYIVNYNTCGGTTLASNIVLNSGSKRISLPQVGGVSVDWYGSEDFTSSSRVGASNSYYTIAQNTTLHAKYPSSNKVYVFFNVNGGDEGGTPATQEITKGSATTITIPVTATPTKVGYTLSGWKIGKSGSATYPVSGGSVAIPASVITTNAITLYADWQVASYTITFKECSSFQTKIRGKFPNATASGGNFLATYKVTDTIALPKLDDVSVGGTAYSFIGWEVETSADVWKLSNVLKSEVQASGLYGNVTIKPLWVLKDRVKFQLDKVTKTFGDEDFTNPLMVNFINNTSVSVSYSSSKTSVATISSTGQVKIKGAGTATITATCNGLTVTYSLTINKKDISGANGAVMGSVANQTYTGSAITPTPAVTLGGVQLTAGTDFTYSYSNNTQAGTSATVTATGKGNYTGSVSQTFSIIKAKMSAPTNLTWTSGVAMWDNVTGNSGYIVRLYNGTTQRSGAIVVGANVTQYDFVDLIQAQKLVSSNWKFSVETISGTESYADSEEVVSTAKISTYSITYNSGSVAGVTFGAVPTGYKVQGVRYSLSSTAPTVTAIGTNAKIGSTSITACDFNGWLASGSSTYYDLGETYSVDANLTLTAQWLRAVKFGKYSNLDASWQVLNVESDGAGNSVALVVYRAYINAVTSDGVESVNHIYWDGTNASNQTTCYTDSEIRVWLNSDSESVTVGRASYKGFLKHFTNYDDSKIKTSNIGDLCSVCTISSFGTSSCAHYRGKGGDLTTYASNRGSGDKVFLLGYTDMFEYFHCTTARNRVAQGEMSWWLRSCDISHYVRYVSQSSIGYTFAYTASCGVAPAMFLVL